MEGDFGAIDRAEFIAASLRLYTVSTPKSFRQLTSLESFLADFFALFLFWFPNIMSYQGTLNLIDSL